MGRGTWDGPGTLSFVIGPASLMSLVLRSFVCLSIVLYRTTVVFCDHRLVARHQPDQVHAGADLAAFGVRAVPDHAVRPDPAGAVRRVALTSRPAPS